MTELKGHKEESIGRLFTDDIRYIAVIVLVEVVVLRGFFLTVTLKNVTT